MQKISYEFARIRTNFILKSWCMKFVKNSFMNLHMNSCTNSCMNITFLKRRCGENISVLFILYRSSCVKFYLHGRHRDMLISSKAISYSKLFNSLCPRAQVTKLLCYSQSKNRLHRDPLYFVTSIVGTGNREGKSK